MAVLVTFPPYPSQVGPQPLSRGGVAPMFHLADAQMVFAVTLACGEHHIEPFHPGFTLGAISRGQITHIVLVPTMIQMMLQACKDNRPDCSCLRSVLYGASPMPD